MLLELFDHRLVDYSKFLNLEPEGRIGPELRGSSLVRRPFIDFIFENRDMGLTSPEEGFPGRDKRLEDVI